MINYPALYLSTLSSLKGRVSRHRLGNPLHEHNAGQAIDSNPT